MTVLEVRPRQSIRFPWPINLKAEGKINGTSFSINGTGVIRTLGVYEAILNFDQLPPHFHPSAIATFSISNCCGAGASMRNGGVNMSTMGVKSYRVNRKLGLAGGKIEMVGIANFDPEALSLDIKINGDLELPDDLSGHSVYLKRVEPVEGKQEKLLGVGEGSLFRSNGEEIPVQIDTEYTILSPDPSDLEHPLTKPEFRIATEDGELYGLSYRTKIHSIFDGVNSMVNVQHRPYQG